MNLTGKRYGRITVGEIVSNEGWKLRYHCICDCGNTFVAQGTNLKTGNTKSCGCLREFIRNEIFVEHNKTGSKIHNAWMAMKSRCNNPKNMSYQYYGGKGIRVCKRWMGSFEAFLEDMGEPPTGKHSIDRINSCGDYEPSNCRWATHKEQNRNRSISRNITIGDKTQYISAWAEEMGVKPSKIGQRLRRGWHPVMAIFQP